MHTHTQEGPYTKTHTHTLAITHSQTHTSRHPHTYLHALHTPTKILPVCRNTLRNIHVKTQGRFKRIHTLSLTHTHTHKHIPAQISTHSNHTDTHRQTHLWHVHTLRHIHTNTNVYLATCYKIARQFWLIYFSQIYSDETQSSSGLGSAWRLA